MVYLINHKLNEKAFLSGLMPIMLLDSFVLENVETKKMP